MVLRVCDEKHTPFKEPVELEALRNKIVIFASGMSRIADLEAGAGVWMGLRSRGIGVDSGAFGEFKRSLRNPSAKPARVCDLFSDEIDRMLANRRTVDFHMMWMRYESIKATIAYFLNGESGIEGAASESNPDYPRPLFVMPDIVGDQLASLALVSRYQSYILEEIEQNQSRPIIPIQIGELTLSQAYESVVSILGTDDFIVGAPSNEKAVSPQELEAFLLDARPMQLHFLGAAADKSLLPKLQIMADVGHLPTHLSADANICRSAIYGRITDEKRYVAIQEALYERSAEAQRHFSGLPGLRKARPGELLEDGSTVVLKGIRSRMQAETLAADYENGRVVQDGPCRYAVVRN